MKKNSIIWLIICVREKIDNILSMRTEYKKAKKIAASQQIDWYEMQIKHLLKTYKNIEYELQELYNNNNNNDIK